MSQLHEIVIGVPGLDDYPETISPFWYKISDMQDLYRFNEFFPKNVKNLEKDSKIMGWKKSRGDGNCYFRAVISTAFLKMCKPYTEIKQLINLKGKIESLSNEGTDYEYSQAKVYILTELSKIIDLKNKKQSIQAFEYALKLTQKSEFDLDLVRISRLLVFNEVLKAQDDDEYSFLFLDGIDPILYDVMAMGKEGGDHSLLFLPKGLGIQVVQYMFLDTAKPSIQKFPENVSEGATQISIVRRAGHYDVLLSIQEFELDQVEMNTGVYKFVKQFDETLHSSFYTQFIAYIKNAVDSILF